MSSHISEKPHLTEDKGDWVLVLKRILEHSREDVFAALTQADQISSWGPFKADRDLTTIGEVILEHIDMPEAEKMPGYVLEVEPPHLLVMRWGDDILRWELGRDGEKTALTLRHRFADRKQAPSYAAGWHLCLDGLAGTLTGEKMPLMVGHNAIKYGWQELYAQYEKLLGMNQSSVN